MAIQEGDKIPEATVHHMTDAGPTPITTSELFSGKRSVLFAVPGAFTPGCSMHHLPGFIDNSDEILGKENSLLKPFRFNRYAKGELHPVSHSPFPWS